MAKNQTLSLPLAHLHLKKQKLYTARLWGNICHNKLSVQAAEVLWQLVNWHTQQLSTQFLLFLSCSIHWQLCLLHMSKTDQQSANLKLLKLHAKTCRSIPHLNVNAKSWVTALKSLGLPFFHKKHTHQNGCDHFSPHGSHVIWKTSPE